MPLIIPLISLLLCPGVVRPVPGDVVQGFSPQGSYAGHWGIDLAAEVGTPVRAVRSGVVTFAGPVAGRLRRDHCHFDMIYVPGNIFKFNFVDGI